MRNNRYIFRVSRKINFWKNDKNNPWRLENIRKNAPFRRILTLATYKKKLTRSITTKM